MSENKSSSMGCLGKGCIAAVICLVVLIVGGLFTGYYILFHTAIPARALVAVLNQSPEIQIEGIEGSISSGFTVETMRFTDDAGNVNALDDVRFKYEEEDETIIITEVHVGRGHFYIDRGESDDSSESTPGSEPQTEPDRTPTGGTDSGSQQRIVVQSISINDVTVEDVGTGEIFRLEGIQARDLELGDDFSLGELVVECTACDLDIRPVAGDAGELYTVDGLLKPGLHDNIIAAIDVKGIVDASDPDNPATDLTAFDGKLAIKGEENGLSVTVKRLDPSDYFKNAPPLTDITLNLKKQKESASAKGAFLVGSNRFVIDQVVPVPKGGKLAEDLTGVCRTPGATYTIRFPVRETRPETLPKMKLSADPAMPPGDALAVLLFGKKGEALTGEEKEQLDKALSHFEVPEETPPSSTPENEKKEKEE